MIGTPGSGPDSNGGTVGAVVGVLVFILLLSVTAGSVGLILAFISKKHKKKQLQRMQMDILAVYVLIMSSLPGVSFANVCSYYFTCAPHLF